MPQFIPVSDLRDYNKVISQITPENPVYLTRHGRNATLAIVDATEYERLKKLEASTQLLEALRKGAQSGEQEGWISAENMEDFFNGEED